MTHHTVCHFKRKSTESVLKMDSGGPLSVNVLLQRGIGLDSEGGFCIPVRRVNRYANSVTAVASSACDVSFSTADEHHVESARLRPLQHV